MSDSSKGGHSAKVFDFVDKLETCFSQEDVISAVVEILNEFGFEHFIVTGLPNPAERFEQLVVMRHWPVGWFEHYAQNEYVKVDPVIRLCRNTTLPFAWEEAGYSPEREPKAREVMSRAVDFGLCKGFTVPVHGIDGYEACFSMSGRHVEIDNLIKPAIHLVAMYAFERARRVALDKADRRNPLTEREREVLTWSALGKSSRDVAEILAITERTAGQHVANAMAKLGAANKTQAVVRAMQSRFIRV